MSSQRMSEKLQDHNSHPSDRRSPFEHKPSSLSTTEDRHNPFEDKASSSSTTAEVEAPPSTEEKGEKAMLPSHSTLVFGNYPPLWPSSSEPSPRPKRLQSGTQQYTSAESMRAILDRGPSASKKPSHRFEEMDPSNHHQYLQGPDRRYTHPRLNVFGEDITPVGRAPSLGWRKKK